MTSDLRSNKLITTVVSFGFHQHLDSWFKNGTNQWSYHTQGTCSKANWVWITQDFQTTQLFHSAPHSVQVFVVQLLGTKKLTSAGFGNKFGGKLHRNTNWTTWSGLSIKRKHCYYHMKLCISTVKNITGQAPGTVCAYTQYSNNYKNDFELLSTAYLKTPLIFMIIKFIDS